MRNLWLFPARVFVTLLCIGLLAWMTMAIQLSPLEPTWLRLALAALVPVGALAALIFVRPLRRVSFGIAGVFILVLAAWSTIAPSNDRDWQPDVAELSYADIRGDQVTLHNVRNVEYRSETDFTVHYETRELDLSKLHALDLFLIYWGSPMIAHTIMSWEFSDGQHIAISIETRKEVGEEYSALRGFFRQFEIIYVVADERDVVGLRTNFRGEDVYLYRLDVPPEGARLLLLSYLEAVNGLYERAEWYNALTDNCTTTIQHLAARHEGRDWRSWKLILNGYLDELAYEIGAVDTSLPFETLKQRSYINQKAQAAGSGADFSRQIRVGLPGTSANPGT